MSLKQFIPAVIAGPRIGGKQPGTARRVKNYVASLGRPPHHRTAPLDFNGDID